MQIRRRVRYGRKLAARIIYLVALSDQGDCIPLQRLSSKENMAVTLLASAGVISQYAGQALFPRSFTPDEAHIQLAFVLRR